MQTIMQFNGSVDVTVPGEYTTNGCTLVNADGKLVYVDVNGQKFAVVETRTVRLGLMITRVTVIYDDEPVAEKVPEKEEPAPAEDVPAEAEPEEDPPEVVALSLDDLKMLVDKLQNRIAVLEKPAEPVVEEPVEETLVEEPILVEEPVEESPSESGEIILEEPVEEVPKSVTVSVGGKTIDIADEDGVTVIRIL